MLDSAEWFIAEFGSSGLSPFQRLWRWLYQRYVPDIHGIGTDYESGRKWKKVEESGMNQSDQIALIENSHDG
jgi:hypothetical protein